MYSALNMELEIIRTVLKNKVNDIYVCTDRLKNTGVFYTMISIHQPKYRKLAAEQMNSEPLFYANRDFVGSFVYENKLNLVFRYYHENPLSSLGSVYLESFADCKEAAIRLVSALAEAGAGKGLGLLMLEERNLNLMREGGVQLNYFLDYAKYRENAGDREFFDALADRTFEVLELNYKDRYSSPEAYPDDLRLYYMKRKAGDFSSFGQILSAVRAMSDRQIEMRGFFWWIRSRFRMTRNFLFRNSMNTFLTILVIATLVYAGIEISARVRAKRAYENNISYYGLEYIGNVYLGDEE